MEYVLSEVSPPIMVGMFILGTVLGSFLNVVVYRLGTGERIGRDRSRCFACGATLGWYDLIPLLSFAVQKGRCRYCGSRISWQYPVVEFLSGVIFTLVAYHVWNYELQITNSNLLLTTYYLLLFSFLLVISVYDIRHKIIPNQLVYPFIIFSFFFPILHNSLASLTLQRSGYFIIQSIISYTLAGIATFTFFGGLWFFSKGRWMGFGDAKLALGIGFLLGPSLTALAVILSFWIGTLIAVPVTLLWGGGLKTQIPFGPFLAAGCFAAWLLGERLLSWYFTLL